VVLEEWVMPEAPSDGGSAGREGREYVILVCFFFKCRNIIIFEPPKKMMFVWICFMNTRRELGLGAQTSGN
jgi:hypothetical protein